jgi:hypothetical protein
MIDLLPAIRDSIEGLGLFRDVFISELVETEGVNIPPQSRLPACGIKDNGEEVKDLTAGERELHQDVLVVIFEKTQAERDTGQGLLASLGLAKQVRDHLHGNLLLDDMQLAAYQGADASGVADFRGLGLASMIVQFYRFERLGG